MSWLNDSWQTQSAQVGDTELISVNFQVTKNCVSYVAVRRRLTGVILTTTGVQRPEVLHNNKHQFDRVSLNSSLIVHLSLLDSCCMINGNLS